MECMYLVLVLLCENLVVVLVFCMLLLPQMVPLSRSCLESCELGLTWFDHQGRVSHLDLKTPGESDRGLGNGDSDGGPWMSCSQAHTPLWCNSEGITGVPCVEEERFCWTLRLDIFDWCTVSSEQCLIYYYLNVYCLIVHALISWIFDWWTTRLAWVWGWVDG